MRRAVVRRLDVVSVIRVVFSLSLALWAVVLVGLVALYIVGLVAGGLGGVEGFMASLGFTGFRLSVALFVPLVALAGIVASAVAAAVSGLVGLLYNALTPLVGGVEIVTREDHRAG